MKLFTTLKHKIKIDYLYYDAYDGSDDFKRRRLLEGEKKTYLMHEIIYYNPECSGTGGADISYQSLTSNSRRFSL